jgi:pimeloyl-ACP methyl ester carboxylesterase/membrane protein DedA with SNARE-associated domain
MSGAAWRTRLGILYLLLLIASHLFQYVRGDDPVLPVSQSLLVVSGEQGQPVRLAYFDSDPHASDKPVVVLLHGSPAGIGLFMPLIHELRQSYRVLAPSMPGFENSTRRIPDYSIRAHSRYLAAYLRGMNLHRVHLVGYSMGSGVAIEFAHSHPNTLQSLILLSGIGAQEHELLGDYTLNHLVHGLQLAGLWCVDFFLPHFGFFDDFPLNYYYARNFYDTDQRPLKGYLSQYRGPALIIHGDADQLVPNAAASKHHALMPQSELVTVAHSGHLLLYCKPKITASYIEKFITAVESGYSSQHLVRTPAEQSLAMQALGENHVEPWQGITLVIMMVLIALATFASEDLATVSAGMLAANGNLSLAAAITAAFLGIFIGDLLLVFIGRLLARSQWLQHLFSKHLGKNAGERFGRLTDRKLFLAILASRFMPGARLPLYLAIGVAGKNLAVTTSAFVLAGALWVPLICALSYYCGEAIFTYLTRYDRAAILTFIALAAIYLTFKKILIPLATWRGRRLLYSRWLRLTQWEFWPPYIFYIPLGFYFVYLGIRYRSLTVFTAANPGIEDGGVIGESKSQILRSIAVKKHVARFILIKPAEPVVRLNQLAEFMRAQRLKFPVVLKPDAGERGNAVSIVRSSDAVSEYFAANPSAVIAQEYISGLEYGIFYYRMPTAAHGTILAITDKRFPKLTGDGVSTLEQLILRDPRAVMMARFHLEKYADRLDEVVVVGEDFKLVELGTHCKGSLFLEGMHLCTPQLTETVDRISKTFPGFYFGRYDIKVPSEIDLRRGKNLKVLELNGVTSEATSIYDPAHSLVHAYRTLAKQWHLAFEIGAQNVKLGATATPIMSLLRNIFSPMTRRG